MWLANLGDVTRNDDVLVLDQTGLNPRAERRSSNAGQTRMVDATSISFHSLFYLYLWYIGTAAFETEEIR